MLLLPSEPRLHIFRRCLKLIFQAAQWFPKGDGRDLLLTWFNRAGYRIYSALHLRGSSTEEGVKFRGSVIHLSRFAIGEGASKIPLMVPPPLMNRLIFVFSH